MAKRIEGPYDFSKYGFSRYNDGATWELTEGEDFSVKPQSLAGNVRRWAREEGLEVQVKVIEGTQRSPGVVAVRFQRRPELRRIAGDA